MTDDTDKLAAQMKNLRPSKKSRKSGMEAAMAAFGKEFAVETAASDIRDSADLEKNSTSTQGLADAARPTVKHTKTVRVKTRRVETMSKFTSIFQKPQAMMMAGTCGAALIAAMVVLPNMDEFGVQEQIAEVAAVETVAEIDASEETSDVQSEVTVVPVDPLPETELKAPKKASDTDTVSVTATNSADSAKVATASEPTGGIGKIDRLLTPIQSQPAPPQPGMSIPQSAPGIKQQLEDALAAKRQGDSVIVEAISAEDIGKTTDQNIAEALQRTAGISTESQNRPGRKVTVRGANVNLNNVTLSGVPLSMSVEANASTPAMSRRDRFGGLTLEEIPGEYETRKESVVTQEASTELVTIPAEFETVTETVVVTPQSVEYVVEPAEYKWVDGEIEGAEVTYEAKPAEYETVTETVVVQEASTELVTIPPTYETVMDTIVVQPQQVAADGSVTPVVTQEVSRRVVKTPASTVERTIPSVTKTQTRRVVKTPAAAIEKRVPYETKNGKTRVPVKAAKVKERAVPAITKQVSRRVVKTPARTIERAIPNVSRTYERQVLVKPPKFYLRDEDGNVVREFESRDAFEIYKANLPTVVEETPVSTFSVDVDSASYSFLRASVNRGQLPPRSAIRLEEMINYFPYDYDTPRSADMPFKANVTVTPNPWNADTKLMHIGIKGYVPKQTEKPRSNLVFLIDTSGSMNHPNKLPLLINSFKLLLNTLDKDDTVSIVAYASASGTVLEPTAVKNKSEILNALNNLRAGGSTAGAAGLELAYKKAQESFDDEGVNRVILATDGDFNVGFSSPDEMKNFIKDKRETGIFLSVLGFGMGNYNDHLMQSLAQNGNGVAAYIDNLAEANKVLANEAGSALFTIAKDVKIQVEFNPATIAEYRLIGYETRALKRQDFNNDKVDAGEIGAGHSVTAIYEMTPVGSPAITVDKLRYVSAEDKPKSTGSDEFAFVKIRHKLPKADKSTLQTFPIGKRQERSLKRASNDMRFATAVAAVGQKLRGDVQVEGYSYEDAIELAQGAKGKDENGYRAEFIQMVKLIDTMSK